MDTSKTKPRRFLDFMYEIARKKLAENPNYFNFKKTKNMYIIFDTETTGLPKRWHAPITETDNWPRCVQLAWAVYDEQGNLVKKQEYLIKPDGFTVPNDATRIHGISTEMLQEKGVDMQMVLKEFDTDLSNVKYVVGHNILFNINIMGCELHRYSITSKLLELPYLDTCAEETAQLCQLSGSRGGRFKLPTVTELYRHLFNENFDDSVSAIKLVEAVAQCFFELIRLHGVSFFVVNFIVKKEVEEEEEFENEDGFDEYE